MIKLNGESIDFTRDIELNKDDSIAYFLVKRLIKEAGLNITKVVRMMNEAHPEHKTTTQNLCNKLSRDTLKVSEFLEIIELCGYNFSFEKIGSGETKETQPETKTEKTYTELLLEGYADCKSVNFQSILIAGAKAQEAAQWIIDNLDNEFSETQEIMLLIAANRQFGVNCKPIAEGRTFRMV